jgi:intergrase/recombinase
MNYKKISLFERFDENPFIEAVKKEVNITKKTTIVQAKDKGEIQMIVSQSGDVEGYSAFMKFVEVDEDKFAKLYLKQFEAFWDLSKPAIRIFGYIINSLKPNQDFFILRMDKCLEYTKYKTKAPIISGLADLIDKGIIAKSSYENMYFINPLIVFNGSRVTFAKTYVKTQPNTKEIETHEIKKIQGSSENWG